MRIIKLSIFAALFSTAGITALNVLKEMKIKLVNAQIKMISNYIKLQISSGENLPNFNNINFQIFLNKNMDGPIDSRSKDPWNKNFKVQYSKNNLIIISSGPDTLINTPDDIIENTKIPKR